MEANIAKLKEWIDGSDNIVFFGGAGVSTESGIPDFRSVDGLYNQKWKYPPETILSHTFFERYPEEYYRFHREKLVIDGVKPNRCHLLRDAYSGPAEAGTGGKAPRGRHAEYRRSASGRREQKRPGAARQHPARLLLPLPQKL